MKNGKIHSGGHSKDVGDPAGIERHQGKRSIMTDIQAAQIGFEQNRRRIGVVSADEQLFGNLFVRKGLNQDLEVVGGIERDPQGRFVQSAVGTVQESGAGGIQLEHIGSKGTRR